jgi:hypothetical protein
MRLRVVIIVGLAVSLHLALFVALGRIARNKGPLIPSLSAAAAPSPTPHAASPSTSIVAPPAAAPQAEAPTLAPPIRPRKTIKHPRPDRAAAARPPVFEINADAAETTAP